MVAQYDELVSEIDEAESELDELRRTLHTQYDINRMWIDAHDKVEQERDSARRWSAAWKRGAKANKARHLHDVIKYKLQYRTAVKERDELRAQLANAAASEVEAVQGRQECEAELREARERIRALAVVVTSNASDAARYRTERDAARKQRRLLAEEALRASEGAPVRPATKDLARSIVEEPAA